MNILHLKRFYNSIFEGVPGWTRRRSREEIELDESYDYFWSYFKGLKMVILKWEKCNTRYKARLSITRWKLTSPTERVSCPRVDNFWIMAVGKLCDDIGSELGLIYNARYYRYEIPKKRKKRKYCRLADIIAYQEKFKI